jgi:hypothetical protein
MPNDYGACSARGRIAAAALVVLALGAPRANVAAAPTAPESAPLPEARAEPASARDDNPAVEAPPAAPASGRRPVFVCEDAGIPVFSDRPCGAALTPRTVSFAAPPAGAAVSTSPPAPRAITKPLPATERPAGDKPAGRCAALRRQLEDLDDRMRTGYTSREAARLWNRWRDLKSRLRSERC